MYKPLLTAFLLITHIVPAAAQLKNPVPAHYNSNMQRLLIFATGSFVYGSMQGQLDKDSAMLFAAKIFGLNRLLAYTEGYAINPQEYAWLNQGNITEIKKRATAGSDADRIQRHALLGIYYLFKTGAFKNDLDSALHYIKAAKNLSIQTNNKNWENETTRLLGIYYFQAGDLAQSAQHFDELVKDCRLGHDEFALATALLNQAEYLPFGNPSKILLLEEAGLLFTKLKNPIKLYEVLNAKVVEYFFTGNNLAEQNLLQLLTLSKKMGFNHDQYIHYTLTYLYMQRADFIKAMAQAQACIKSMEATKDTVFSSLYCYRMGNVLLSAGKKQEGEYWNDRAFNVYKTRENEPFWYASFLVKSGGLISKGQPKLALDLLEDIDRQFPADNAIHALDIVYLRGGCNELLGNTAAAKQAYDAFVRMAENIPRHFWMENIVGALPNIGIFFFENKYYAEARKTLAASLASPLEKLSVFNQERLFLLQFKIDSLNGDYLAAIKKYQQFKQLSDSGFNITQRNKMDQLMLQYATEKKDQDIQMLKQEGEIREGKLKQSDFTVKMAFAGVALLAVIIVLLYNQYRLKQRAGKETEARNQALQKLLNEKEWLLKEVHHRVKNNLQTVVSLLESQSAYLNNDALLAVQDSQNRIYAMSLIHQKLYQAENVAAINMAGYLPQLVQYLRDSFDTRQRIQFRLQIDPVELDVSQAVPVGLILNEAITNAIKYAFKHVQDDKVVDISMKENGEGMIHLQITDNGIGLPPQFDPENAGGLGLKLMRGLTGDIEGSFNISNDNGTTVSIMFKANKPLHTADEVSISKLLGKTA